jgi:hypothetical protein
MCRCSRAVIHATMCPGEVMEGVDWKASEGFKNRLGNRISDPMMPDSGIESCRNRHLVLIKAAHVVDKTGI